MTSFLKPFLTLALFLIEYPVTYAQLWVDATRYENNQRPLGISVTDFHFGWELGAEGRSENRKVQQGRFTG